jgi:hypothetical protein
LAGKAEIPRRFEDVCHGLLGGVNIVQHEIALLEARLATSCQFLQEFSQILATKKHGD